MTNLQLILLIIQIIVVLIMICLVLLQKSGNNSLSGIGASGGVNSAISSKAGNAALTKSIMILVAIFMTNCLILATITARSSDSSMLKIDQAIEQQEKEQNNKLKIPDIDE
jgi:protein translocase SecG subunit